MMTLLPRCGLNRIWLSLLLLLLVWVSLAAAREKGFGGIGLQVVPTVDGNLVVLRVVEESPAAGAGLKPGDFIFQVDDLVLAGSNFAEIVADYLWGEVGTAVTVHFLRPGEEGEKSVSLTRIAMDAEIGETPGVRMLKPE